MKNRTAHAALLILLALAPILAAAAPGEVDAEYVPPSVGGEALIITGTAAATQPTPLLPMGAAALALAAYLHARHRSKR